MSAGRPFKFLAEGCTLGRTVSRGRPLLAGWGGSLDHYDHRDVHGDAHHDYEHHQHHHHHHHLHLHHDHDRYDVDDEFFSNKKHVSSVTSRKLSFCVVGVRISPKLNFDNL